MGIGSGIFEGNVNDVGENLEIYTGMGMLVWEWEFGTHSCSHLLHSRQLPYLSNGDQTREGLLLLILHIQ